MSRSICSIPTYDLILVDTMNVAVINFYAKKMLSYEGIPTGMVYGVFLQILTLRKRYPKAKIVFLWEGFNSLRKSKYPTYKSNRNRNKDDSFKQSLEDLQASLAWMGVYQVTHPCVEADDLAAYYCKKNHEHGILLVSNDRDWWGCVDRPDISVLIKNEEYNLTDLENKLGFPPSKLPLMKILKGDLSDNVTGIPRFPVSLATEIVKKSKSYEDMLSYKFKQGNKWESAFTEYADTLRMNADLILFHPEWIDSAKLKIVKPTKNDLLLKTFLERRGMHVFLRQLNL